MDKKNPYSRARTVTGKINRQPGHYFDIRDEGDSKNNDRDLVDCLKCKFFYVTWEPAFPRGCKLFQFKTAKLPSDLVLESTGQSCQQFQPKQKR